MTPAEFMRKAADALESYDASEDDIDLRRAEIWAQVALHVASGGSAQSALRMLSHDSREAVRKHWADIETIDMHAQRARDEIIGKLHYS